MKDVITPNPTLNPTLSVKGADFGSGVLEVLGTGIEVEVAGADVKVAPFELGDNVVGLGTEPPDVEYLVGEFVETTILLEICTLMEVAKAVEYLSVVEVSSLVDVCNIIEISASQDIDVDTSTSDVDVWSWLSPPMMVIADPLDTEKVPSLVPQSHNPRSASGPQQKTLFPQATRPPPLSSTGLSAIVSANLKSHTLTDTHPDRSPHIWNHSIMDCCILHVLLIRMDARTLLYPDP